MKKIIMKTAFITFGVTLVLAVSLFGIVSFCAPAAMMRFFESLGLENIGGDYAYQEYQNTGELSYLAHAFEVAADARNDAVAEARFGELYEKEDFGAFCENQEGAALPSGVPDYGYRAYLCGRAAVVRYRLALTDDEKEETCDFAISESEASLSADSPVIVLALNAIDAHDGAFCKLLLGKIRRETKFDVENEHYVNFINFLEEAANE